MPTRNVRYRFLFLTMVGLLTISLTATTGWAQKSRGPGNGGGGSTPELDYDVVILTGVDDARSQAVAISEPRVDENSSLNRSIYICGKMAVDKVESPVRIALWQIDRYGNVVATIDHGNVLESCYAVNSHGMIAGQFQSGPQDHRPAVLTADGLRIDLPVPPEATNGWANAITDPDANGVVTVVGGWETGDEYGILARAGRQWFIDIASNEYRDSLDLTTLPDFIPVDMNQQGDMVGFQPPPWGSVSSKCIAAWLVSPNVWLTESLPGFVDVEAIDEEGNIVGNWRSENTNNQGVIHLADGTLINLAELGRPKTEAYDIATVDGVVQVVGATKDSSGLIVGYVWSNGEFIELDKLVGSGQAWIAPATGINSRGEICGVGNFGSRRQRWEYGYLLIPKTN